MRVNADALKGDFFSPGCVVRFGGMNFRVRKLSGFMNFESAKRKMRGEVIAFYWVLFIWIGEMQFGLRSHYDYFALCGFGVGFV